MGTCTGHCTCGACDPIGTGPAAIENRPSLPVVSYRRGTFAQVRNRLLAEIGLDPTLARLATRGTDDHVVAAIELWSVVADVIDFYGERYINEAFLGTATQERSVERLARMVGYRPRPGVAAIAWLAFTLERDTTAFLAAGVPVQSVPGPATGAAPPTPPVTYETLDDLPAAALWNAITAYTEADVGPPLATGQLASVLDRLDAPTLAATLRAQDRVVLWGPAGVEEKVVAGVHVRPDRAVVTWTEPVAGSTGGATGSTPRARKVRRMLKVFGSAAPDQWMKASTSTSSVGGIGWTLQATTGFGVAASATTIDLEGKVDDLEVGSLLLVAAPGHPPMAVSVQSVGAARATVGPLTADVTRVTTGQGLPAHDLRTVRVYALVGPELTFWGGEYPDADLAAVVQVPVWRTPLPDGRDGVEVGRTIQGGTWSAGQALDLETVAAGRPLVLVWAGSDEATIPAPQVVALERRPVLPTFDGDGFGHLELHLVRGELSGPDWPRAAAVTVLGNVVRGSHGRTVGEVLGNGDGARPFQRIALQNKPVTFVPAAVPGGLVSTLLVAVDGVRRPEGPTLYGQPGTAAVVATQTMPDGSTVVQGGDGKHMAARFTTGAGNVTARYRVGSGLAGRVDANRLTTLLHPPVGVRAVRNPLASEGGADPERIDGARRNAPASVRTLGRIVSLRDVDDLVLAAGLVAKAQSVWLWSGFDRLIHLTVAAADGGTLSDDLRGTIGAGLDAARDTSHRLRVDDRVLVPITCALRVVIDRLADRPDDVLAAVDATVRSQLGFDTLGLGRSLAVSDLVAAAAAVPLVVAVTVTSFGFSVAAGFDLTELTARGVELGPDGTVLAVQPRLRIYPARPGAAPGTIQPAELASVNAASDIQIIDGGRA